MESNLRDGSYYQNGQHKESEMGRRPAWSGRLEGSAIGKIKDEKGLEVVSQGVLSAESTQIRSQLNLPDISRRRTYRRLTIHTVV